MRRRGVPALAVVFVAGLVLALAACGGGGKKSATPTTSTEVTATESVTTTETTTSTATESTSTESTPATTPSTTNFAKGPCKELSQKAQAAVQSAGAQGDVGKAADALSKVADEAPSEIRGDVHTIADVLKKYADALDKAGYKPGQIPTAAQAAKIAAVAQTFQGDQAKLQAAEAHITAWAKKNCT